MNVECRAVDYWERAERLSHTHQAARRARHVATDHQLALQVRVEVALPVVVVLEAEALLLRAVAAPRPRHSAAPHAPDAPVRRPVPHDALLQRTAATHTPPAVQTRARQTEHLYRSSPSQNRTVIECQCLPFTRSWAVCTKHQSLTVQ